MSSTGSATNPYRAQTLPILREAPDLEREYGNIEASRVASRVVASIPEGGSEIVQTAYAIEAIEKEDYRSWPSTWMISELRVPLLTNLTRWCSAEDCTRFQRERYQELHDFPHLLLRITHGFTRILQMSDKQGFIEELMSAGRRECRRGDEASAISETDVLHIALSYRHANKFDKGGTIDRDTAEEAHEVISKFRASGGVRVWIDQNLHRYPRDGQWYERGFLPYATIRVVSAFGKHGGFGIGRRRPWIWVETGMALSGLGIHCRQEIFSTIEELIVLPQNSVLSAESQEEMGGTLGASISVFEAVSQILRSVSWWTTDMLSHKDYGFASEFQEFAQWAKAQVARMNKKGTLDLSSEKFEDTILENICWMRALPMDTSNRQLFQGPYLRLEIDVGKAQKQLSLLQVSGKCRQQDGVCELLGKVSGMLTFCFTVLANKLCLNVNPSRRPTSVRVHDSEGLGKVQANVDLLKSSRGGYCLWDRRFTPHEVPRFLHCTTIFGRHYGVRSKLGQEGSEIRLGGFNFMRKGFLAVAFHIEGVYVTQLNDDEIYLCESDVLCMREFPEDLQKELVIALRPEAAIPSVARILRAESDITNAQLTPRTIGTTTADIELGIWKIAGEDAGIDEIKIQRIRLGPYVHALSITDDRLGKVVYAFETNVFLEPSLSDLHLKIEGDIDMTLSKVRLMMGSDEFSGYTEDGLSLGTCVYNGSERYPHEFRLEGSEFLLCEECSAIYSPINLMMCVLSSNLRTRKIKARWGSVHGCSATGRACHIIGTVE